MRCSLAEQRKRTAEEVRRTAEQTKWRIVLQQEIAAEEKDMAARKKRTAENEGQHAATPATFYNGDGRCLPAYFKAGEQG